MTIDDPPPLQLKDLAHLDIERLKGVGEKRATALRENDVRSVLDLLRYYPRRYIDRTREAAIADLRPGEEGMVLATVHNVESRRVRGNRSMINVTVGDDSGRLRVTFFNQPWRARQLTEGTEVVLFGKAEDFRGSLQMTSPVVDSDRRSDRPHRARVSAVREVRTRQRRPGPLDCGGATPYQTASIEDPLPTSIRKQHQLIDRMTAVEGIHEPETMADVGHARRRLVFDELFAIQLELVMRQRERAATAIGVDHNATGRSRRISSKPSAFRSPELKNVSSTRSSTTCIDHIRCTACCRVTWARERRWLRSGVFSRPSRAGSRAL